MKGADHAVRFEPTPRVARICHAIQQAVQSEESPQMVADVFLAAAMIGRASRITERDLAAMRETAARVALQIEAQAIARGHT